MQAQVNHTQATEHAAHAHSGSTPLRGASKLFLWGLQAAAAGLGGYLGFDAGLQISGMGLAALMGLCMALCGMLLTSGLSRWLPRHAKVQREA